MGTTTRARDGVQVTKGAHVLLDELADATLERRRKEVMAEFATVPLLIIDDLSMRKLPTSAAEGCSS